MDHIGEILLSPPVAFGLILIVSLAGARLSKRLAARPTQNEPGKFIAYACGEDIAHPRMQPDYGIFFPYAFAFTILHVVALVVATIPRGTTALGGGLLYLAAAAVGLVVLLRK